MQAIALVTGDEFLVPYNLTVDTKDVLVYMRDLFTVWTIDGISKSAIFERNYAAYLTAIVSHAGFCHNFNMIKAEEILNLDLFENLPRISFNYSTPNNTIWSSTPTFSESFSKLRRKTPLSVGDHRSGYVSSINMVSLYRSQQKYDRNHHKSYDYQGVNYLIHSPFEMPSRFSTKHQTVANYSIIVLLDPTKIIIDEALESYEPKRLAYVN
jgi:hypothetical protein